MKGDLVRVSELGICVLQLVWQGVRGERGRGDIALDELLVTEGQCQQQPSGSHDTDGINQIHRLDVLNTFAFPI